MVFVCKTENMSKLMQYDAFLSTRKDIFVSRPAQAHGRVLHLNCFPVRSNGGTRMGTGERDTDSGR